MEKIEIGSIYLSDEVIKIVEEHKKSMIEANKEEKYQEMLENADFGMYLADLLFKFGYRLDINNILDE